MKALVIQFPGSNRDRDVINALEKISGNKVKTAWQEDEIPHGIDLVVVPGGFSYGDHLRPGAIAARKPVMESVRKIAKKGVRIIGICNGFQILCEAGLLPGILIHNQSLNFVCREVKLEIINNDNPFTQLYQKGEIIKCPVAHQQGNYFAEKKEIEKLEKEGLIALKYADNTNPNGSCNDIAGIVDETKQIIAMMPHPENFIENIQGCDHGYRMFLGGLDLGKKAA